MNPGKNCNWKIKDNCWEISVDTAIYPKEPLLAACCVFLDNCYILLDLDKKRKKYKISLQLKEEFKEKIDINSLPGEFYNELLNNVLRYEISSRNQKVREWIVREALFFNQPKKEQEKFVQEACAAECNGKDRA